MFAYCLNNPINLADYWGKDGKHIELGSGWKYTIHPQDTTTGTKRHIHIFKNGKEYIQNEDGSPHDKGKGTKGKIPKWLNKVLIDKAGWDYNGNRKSFFDGTSVEVYPEGTKYTFADGTSAYHPYDVFSREYYTVDSFEGTYFQGDTTSNSPSNTMPTIYAPIVSPAPLPLFSFDFGWSVVPVPIFF